MKITPLLVTTLVAAFATLSTLEARAQASRTWVSGVGDDANPCSRTAPGKTFAGAISKTAANGTINALDAGGFGAVTIVKPIIIDSSNVLAGVLVPSTNGIIVNLADPVPPALPGRVVLRGLAIEGTGTGLGGIYISKPGTVLIENCTIDGMANGIRIAAAAKVILRNCTIRNSSAAAILVETPGATVTVLDSTLTANAAAISVTAASEVSVGDSNIIANTGAGLAATAGGKIISLKNNRLYGNSPNGKFNSAVPTK